MLFGKFKVSGHSMQPYLSPGDQVLTVSFLKIKKGDVIVFRYNSKFLIKRVTRISEKRYELAGDNKKDTLDGRLFGKIKKHDIIGKVILKL